MLGSFKMVKLMCLLLLIAGLLSCAQGMSPLEKRQATLKARQGMLDAREQEKIQRGRRLLQSGTFPSNAAPPGTTTSTGLYLYTPVNSSYLDGDDFANFFYANYNNNSSPGIALTPGNYTVNTATNYKPWVLLFDCTANLGRRASFQVNMYGSVLYVGNTNLAAVGWDTCANVQFAGSTLTYLQSQQVFTQGTITDLNAAGGANWTIQIDLGYISDPTNQIFANSHLSVFYDGSGHLKQNQSDAVLGPFTSTGAGTFTIQAPYGIPGLYNGIRVVFRGDTYATHMTFCNSCTNFRMIDTSIWQSNIFAVFEALCANSTYINVNVVPDPTPRNRPPPLFSSNADGFHSVYPSYGPSILNSTVLNSGDDCIAVQGNYYVIGQVNTTSNPSQSNTWNITFGSWDCNNLGCLDLQPGSPMQLYTNTFQDLGAATVKSVAVVPQPQNVSGPSATFPAFNYDQASYFAATVIAWPRNWTAAGIWGGVVTNPVLTGVNSNIINNTVGNNRARGIYFRGQNSVISNNNVTGSSAVGIFLSPDFYFLEANWNYNVSVTQNYVNTTTAGIVMTATNLTLQAPIYQNHKSNRISNNIIRGPVHPLIVGSSAGITVNNNLFIDGCCYPYSQGDILYNQGGSSGVLVYASYTTTSTFSANTFTTNSPACRYYGNYRSPYVKGPGASTVKTS